MPTIPNSLFNTAYQNTDTGAPGCIELLRLTHSFYRAQQNLHNPITYETFKQINPNLANEVEAVAATVLALKTLMPSNIKLGQGLHNPVALTTFYGPTVLVEDQFDFYHGDTLIDMPCLITREQFRNLNQRIPSTNEVYLYGEDYTINLTNDTYTLNFTVPKPGDVLIAPVTLTFHPENIGHILPPGLTDLLRERHGSTVTALTYNKLNTLSAIIANWLKAFRGPLTAVQDALNFYLGNLYPHTTGTVENATPDSVTISGITYENPYAIEDPIVNVGQVVTHETNLWPNYVTITDTPDGKVTIKVTNSNLNPDETALRELYQLLTGKQHKHCEVVTNG